jgi:hypothetical protein
VSLLAPETLDTQSSARLGVWLQAASLMVAGWLIWHGAAALQWSRLPLRSLIVQTVWFTLAAWTASVTVTLALYLSSEFLLSHEWDPSYVIRAILQISATAVWFVPASVLYSEFPQRAFAAALLLVVTATRLLYSQWRMIPGDVVPQPDGLFAAHQYSTPLLLRDAAPALTASCCMQACAVAALLHRPYLAAGLACASAAIATVFAMAALDRKNEFQPRLTRSIVSVLLTMLLAIVPTVAGLGLRGSGPFGWGNGNGGAANGKPGPASREPGGTVHSDLAKGFGDGGFPGVILWPEIKPVPTLISPLPEMRGGSLVRAINPLSIPFSGEYWMYRWPYARPPRNSYFQRGSPASLSFRTTDHRPLQMEAHHKLEQAIDLRCCSKIQLAIRNADPHPDTVSLELIVLNTAMRRARQSLGKAQVSPAPNQMLDFPVPVQGGLEEFNEFEVAFLRNRERMDKSAKIAIERFILVPR